MTARYYPHSPIDIRDGTFARVQAMGLFKSVFKARTKPLKTDDQHDLLPNATVWNLGEEREAMGDDNCGAPQFYHRLRLGIELTTVAGDEESLDQDIVALVEHTISTLYSDHTWVNLVEGHHSCNVDYDYPRETKEYLCHAVINIVVSYRSIWDPYTPYDFKSVSLATPQKQYDNPVFVQVEIKE